MLYGFPYVADTLNYAGPPVEDAAGTVYGTYHGVNHTSNDDVADVVFKVVF